MENIVSKYGYIEALLNNKYPFQDRFLTIKLQSNWMQELNSKHLIRYLNSYLEMINEYLPIFIVKYFINLDKIAHIIE